MSLTSRLPGFGAIVAIILSMAPGVSTAAPGVVTAVFEADPCTAAFTAGDFKLGTWDWIGSKYVLVEGTGSSTATLTVNGNGTPESAGICKIGFTLSPLREPGGVRIEPDAFYEKIGTATDGNTGAVHRVRSTGGIDPKPLRGGGTTHDVTVGLLILPATRLPAGTYSGTITVTSQAAQ